MQRLIEPFGRNETQVYMQRLCTQHCHLFPILLTYFGTYFREFGYLNSSCIRKSIILLLKIEEP